MTYSTLRNIEQGEELCISYGDRLTFVDAEANGGGDEGDEEDGCAVLGKIELG